MPLVSVIIPNFNHAAFLDERLKSILNQTYQDFEIIILDDNSTDNSKEVIERYRANEKVGKIFYNETNSGTAFKQWQKGIEAAQGEWVWIAESDDWCEENLLQTLVEGITPATVLAIAQSVVVSVDGKIRWKSEAEYLSRVYSGQEFVKKRMLLDNFGIPNASMCIFKRSTFSNVSNEFTSYKFCGDWLFWVSVAVQGDVFISGKYLNYFRKHGSDVSGPAYRNGLHFKEYFTLLDTFKGRSIITEDERQELLVGKLKMFLKDRRLDPTVAEDIRATFQSLISKGFSKTVYKHKVVSYIKSLNNSI